MSKRFNTMAACFCGCVIGSCLGLMLLLQFDTALFAMLCAGVCPLIACWISGIRDKAQLAKVGVYAAGGWILTYWLEPGVAQSAASYFRRVLALPWVGHDWHVIASMVSTLLAMAGVYFMPVGIESKAREEQG